MKIRTLFLTTAAVSVLCCQSGRAQAPLPYAESFETDGEGTRYDSNTFVVGNDYFERHDFSVANPHPGHSGGVTGLDGNFGWASEDTDPNQSLLPPPNTGGDSTILIQDLDSSGLSNLQVTLNMGVGGIGTSGFESDDAILIEVAFDGNRTTAADLNGGTYTEIGRFVGQGSGFPSPLDVIGASSHADGTDVTSSMAVDYVFDVPAILSGNVLSVRIRYDKTDASEHLVLDDIRVAGMVAASDPPVLAAIEGAALAYTEGDPATQVTNTITVSDNDSANLASGTVSISGGVPAEDQLSATGVGSIVVAGSGTSSLTLTGSGTLAQYQQVLRSVTYLNTNTTNPGIGVRTVGFEVNDGTNGSNTASRALNLVPTVGPGTIPHVESFETDGESTRYLSHTYDAGSDHFVRHDFGTTNPHPTHLGAIGTGLDGSFAWASEDPVSASHPLGDGNDASILIRDLNATGFSTLQVTLAMAVTGFGATGFETSDHVFVEYAFDGDRTGGGNLNGGTYTLLGSFDGQGGTPGPIHVNGASNVADGTALNNNLTDFVFDIPDTGGVLSVRLRYNIDGGSEELVMDNIRVTGIVGPANDPPVLASIEVAPISYTEGDPATPITSTLTVSDPDDTDLESAVVSISSGFDPSEDQLLFTNQNGISGSFAAGILTLTGTSSLANYQTALRSVQYNNTDAVNPSTATRTVDFRVNDGDVNSNLLSRDIQIVPELGAPASLPYCESFETDGEGDRYSSNTYNAPTNGIWFRTDQNPVATGWTTLTGPDGTFFWAGEQTTNPANPLLPDDNGYVKTRNLDVAGLTDLQVEILLAQSRSGTNLWEGIDFIEVQAAFDGNIGDATPASGTFTTIGRFLGATGGQDLQQDTDLNGTPDGPVLDGAFTNYTFPIAGTGNLLAIRVVQHSTGSEEAAFDNICITGMAAGPEIALEGNGAGIANGDVTPDPADHTDFGTVECGIDSDVVRTFTILNTGLELTLTGTPFVQLSGSSDFSVTQQPTSPVAATTGSTTFNITFSPTSLGTKTAVVSIASDDPDDDPFTFTIEGEQVDTTPPVLTLVGGPLTLECGVDTFTEPGFTAIDACEGNLTGSVVIGGPTVDTSTVGTYIITYDVSDSVPNAATQVTRQVDVVDSIPPVFSGAKDKVYTVPTGGSADATAHFAGISATDICEGPVAHTCGVLPGPGPLPAGNLFGVGVHQIECTAQDSTGNTATANFNIVVLEIQTSPFARSLDIVSLRGDAATGGGLPGTATINNILRAYLNNNGEIIYSASLSDAGTNNAAVFTGPLASPTAIAVKGTASGAGNFGNFSNLTLNDLGDAGFQSQLGSGPAHFLDTGGGPAATAVKGGLAPTGGGELYGTLQKPALASNGELLTRSNLELGSGAGVTTADDTLITSSAGTVIAREGAASSLPATNYDQLLNRVVASEDNAYFAFSSSLFETGGFDASDNTGLFTGILGGAPPALVLREGDLAPGTGGGTVRQFLGESINSSGEVAVRCNVEGTGIDATNNEAILTNSGGTLALVAREGDVAPCLPTTLVAFSRFTTTYIGDDGTVCFHAFLKDATGTPAVNSSNDGSIWRWKDGQLHLIAREGDAGNNTDAGIIRTIDSFACSGTGGIAFSVRFLPGIGDTVTSNNAGVYLDRGAADAAPELVLRRNDTFDLGGTTTTVSGIKLSTEENPGGGTGGYGRSINDAGEILLNLTLSGNQSGIFVLAP